MWGEDPPDLHESLTALSLILCPQNMCNQPLHNPIMWKQFLTYLVLGLDLAGPVACWKWGKRTPKKYSTPLPPRL